MIHHRLPEAFDLGTCIKEAAVMVAFFLTLGAWAVILGA